MNNKFFGRKGFTLVELLLGLIALNLMVIGVFLFWDWSTTKANIELEQKRAGEIASDIEAKFAANADYAGAGGVDVRNSFGGNVTVRPSSSVSPNDSFEIVYSDLRSNECFLLVNALYSRTDRIYVGGDLEGGVGREVQATTGVNAGRLVPESTLTNENHCGSMDFITGQGVVVFRFKAKQSEASVGPVCGSACAPQTLTRALACDPGNTGIIEQQRNDTCSGGSLDCPLLVIGAWNTVNDTCTACVPNVETRWVPDSAECAGGTAGTNTWEREQKRIMACPGDSWGSWSDTGGLRNVVNTCASKDCSVKSGDAFAWSVGSYTCNSVASGDVTVGNGNTYSVTDSGAPTTGDAGFACSNGIISAVANPGATCSGEARKPGRWDGGYYQSGIEASCSGITRYNETWSWNWETSSGTMTGNRNCSYNSVKMKVECTGDTGGEGGNPEGYPDGVDCWVGESYSYDLCDGGASGASISEQRGDSCHEL